MSKIRIDKVLPGNVVLHEHGIDDLAQDVLDTFVNVTGDTMTGNLVMSGANIDLGTNYLVGEGGSSGVYVDGSGNVGIGTTSTDGKLTIGSSNSYSELVFSAGGFSNIVAKGSGLVIEQQNADLTLQTRNSGSITIAPDYNTGTGSIYLGTSTNGDTTRVYGQFDVQEGSVGIGTTTPGAKLSIDSSLDSFPSLQTKTKQGQRVFSYLKEDGTNLWYGQYDTSNFHTYLNDRSLWFNMNGNSVRFDGGGNSSSSVSISGSAKFVLNSPPEGGVNLIAINDSGYATASSQLTTVRAMKIGTWAWNGTNGYSIGSRVYLNQTQLSATNNDARFDIADTNNVSLLSILTSSGNVGIGTTSPDYELQVDGTIAPETTDQDLGTSSLRWDLFANTIDADSTVTLTGLTGGTDNTVLILNASNQVATDEIDPKVWDNSLVDSSGGTTNYLTKWTSGGETIGDSLIFDDGTNVGIGTTIPSQKFEVKNGNVRITNATTGSGVAPLIVQNTNAYASPYTQFSQVWLDSAGSVMAWMRNDGTFNMGGSQGQIRGTMIQLNSIGAEGSPVINTGTSYNSGLFFPNSGQDIGFTSVGSEKMRITTAGNVGIGTTTPGAKLHVNGTTDGQQLVVEGHTTQTANLTEWQNSSGTVLSGIDSGGVLLLGETTTPTAVANYGKVYPKADNNLYFQDGAGTEKTILDSEDTLNFDVAMTFYDAQPTRASENNIMGGLLSLATAQPLDSTPTDLVVTKGIGKLFIVVNAGSDINGTITITGEKIDRNTGASTPGHTNTITVDALTTDNSTTDSNGNTKHSFVGGYVSDDWFTGTVTLSTTDLTLTDVDVYHISFHQFNDKPNIILDSFDVSLYTTNVAAEFDGYLFCLEKKDGNKADIALEAELHVGADGETAIANKYWRVRKGNLAKAIDGTTDGVWVDMHYSNHPAYVEDVTMIVNAQRTVSMTS